MTALEITPIDLQGIDPLEVFLRVPQEAQRLSFLLSDGSADSRWSILAWDPVETFSFAKKDESKALVENLKRRRGSPLDGRAGPSSPSNPEIPFVGGAIGAIDYEYGYELLGIPVGTRHGAFVQNPLVEFSFYDQAMVYDHHQKQWWGVNGGNIPVETQDVASLPNASTRVAFTPTWDFDEYKKRFDFIHDNIRRGEIYQACLTFPFIGKPVENPRAFFYSLAKKKAAPMAAYLEQSQRTIMSLSPERFISWDGANLETKPIKGTRKRGKDSSEDEQMKRELLSDEKEKAELCMITDLLRNDMARVSKAGTVKVLKHQALQQTPNVWHTYSHIRSQTKAGISAWEILESMFPGGSISGCPKKRAVELLAEAETSPRGIYTGCIGYISDHGAMDMNIAIRTLEQSKNHLQASFGGGVVYDSVAEAEYEECFIKSRVLHS